MEDQSRPVLPKTSSSGEKAMNVISVLLLLSSLAYIIYMWNDLPESVPIHFNGLGEPDRWGGKGGVLTLPIVGFFVFSLTYGLSKFPHGFNYPIPVTKENAEKLYRISKTMLATLNLVMSFFFSIGTWEMVQVAFGKPGFGVWYLPLLFVGLFGTIGYYLFRMFRLK